MTGPLNCQRRLKAFLTYILEVSRSFWYESHLKGWWRAVPAKWLRRQGQRPCPALTLGQGGVGMGIMRRGATKRGKVDWFSGFNGSLKLFCSANETPIEDLERSPGEKYLSESSLVVHPIHVKDTTRRCGLTLGETLLVPTHGTCLLF